MILVWSPEAFADLARERRYLAARNAVGARNQLRRIRRAPRALLTFPRMGTQVTFAGQAAFVFAVPGTEYLLIYDLDREVVRIPAGVEWSPSKAAIRSSDRWRLRTAHDGEAALCHSSVHSSRKTNHL